ncbi:MAG: hypothetical protein JWQ97_1370 [Phenylobacterium sp.]|nr:hypothetical protein [Phenylobacterium sp.]
MRAILAAALGLAAVPILGLAAPASAQLLTPRPFASPNLQQQMDLQLRLNALQAQQSQANSQAVTQQNQLMNLEAQLQAQQAYANVQAESATPRLAPPPVIGPMPQIDTSQLASMPDAALAASNARIRAAAANRH